MDELRLSVLRNILWSKGFTYKNQKTKEDNSR
jgi:hypothetical protein